MINRGKLERGEVTEQLIHSLATKDMSAVKLAERFGVTRGSINNFKLRHADEIEKYKSELRSKVQDEWIFDKTQRVLKLQKIVTDTEKDLEVAAKSGSSVPRAENRRVQIQALHNAAEELGELYARPVNTFNTTTQVVTQLIGFTEEDFARWDKPFNQEESEKHEIARKANRELLAAQGLTPSVLTVGGQVTEIVTDADGNRYLPPVIDMEEESA